MKIWITGKSNYHEWHEWFAWFPVIADDYIVWLEKVKRRWDTYPENIPECRCWVYKL